MAEEITLNQIGVMIEGLRSDVKAVAEGHAVIRHEMHQMKEELVEKIDQNTQSLKSLSQVMGNKLAEHIRQPMHSI